ncbi:hypothetical protein [Pelagibacterium limicola]|uniref:hypothetical protein n=1 Tax=Pelagibacterium limicola TaxID=2791022 RepID=UPI0018AF6316|nr:hypothetical protein [Pelagibacterium limicola]
MADYRELLRRAIDALPENTGANRRAVYEKARSALVAQLRAIEPPLPAREITTHRLNLEDCIRQVEQEATDKLLGRFREVENATAVPPFQEAAPEPVVEEIPSEPQVEEPEPDPDPEPVAVPVEDDFVEPVFATPAYAEPQTAEEPDQDGPPEPEVADSDDVAEQEAGASFDDPSDRFEEPVLRPATEPAQAFAVAGAAASSSIEDIIAAAEAAANDKPGSTAIGIADEPAAALDDAPPVRGSLAIEPLIEEISEPVPEPERHFIASPHDAEPRTGVPLVDLHGQPLTKSEPGSFARPEAAMSSVREVDLEPRTQLDTGISDAQVAIDRAIAALDREARGETAENEGGDTPENEPPADDTLQPSAGSDGGRSGGIGALTVFLLLAVLLLGGGGAAGFWAWREGYINLNTIFAQADPTPPATEVAETQDPALELAPEVSGNTTPDVPTTPGVNGEAMPGEELPFVETETPSPASVEPEASFEDRLPAEAGESLEGTDEPITQEAIAAAASGPQSLLLEEQASGTAGAIPYSGSVEWSRGSDELGHPTIVAQATIPARNLEMRMLIRRNADRNLPASHLIEINFVLAESFVGGSIANLPGVLLKDEELVQGQPLTGASARIVGNSFLFALSSASERDVAANEVLLRDRGWLDLAMVYGTGRRAILTLEKGEDGAEIFQAVMEAWAELDAATAPADAG